MAQKVNYSWVMTQIPAFRLKGKSRSRIQRFKRAFVCGSGAILLLVISGCATSDMRLAVGRSPAADTVDAGAQAVMLSDVVAIVVETDIGCKVQFQEIPGIYYLNKTNKRFDRILDALKVSQTSRNTVTLDADPNEFADHLFKKVLSSCGRARVDVTSSFMKIRALMWLVLCVSIPSWADTLESFYGSYRTQSYNGLQDVYSGRFFIPSIDPEPSNKNSESCRKVL